MTTPGIQMQSTRLPAHIFYSGMADRLARDPVVEYQGRATVPMGRGFALWQRMNADQQLIWIDDMEGRPRAVTPKQAAVLALALEMVDGQMLTMRAMATRLGYAPSTVSRALTKLSAWGVIAYVVGRGRFAGLVIFKRVKDDGLDRFRDAARARVRRWSEAVKRRVSRLEFNVASYILDRERGVDSLYYYLLSIDSSKSATLTAQLSSDWTAEDVAGVS
jgi:DNA-binding MarR family transcriptional regulator